MFLTLGIWDVKIKTEVSVMHSFDHIHGPHTITSFLGEMFRQADRNIKYHKRVLITLFGFVCLLIFYLTFLKFSVYFFSQAELQKQTGADERCLVFEGDACFLCVTPHYLPVTDLGLPQSRQATG